MDVVLLSRLQFAMATMFHWIFVPLTLGLSIIVAIMETLYIKRGDETYRHMAQFWGRLFLINFAIGIVTGITLEFQFGTNWARYSAYVGDIFGSLLAIEATLAFFLESTFIAVWVFGWKKLSPKLHVTAIWIVAIASNISAYWILSANAWMQHPVGYVIRNGRAELADFFTVVTQKFAILEFFHTTWAAYVLAGFFVMGVSAWHLLRKQHVDFFVKSFKLALVWTTIFGIGLVVEGHMHGAELSHSQPAKLAAMESHWETQTHAPLYLFSLPDTQNEKNSVQVLPLPSGLSLLATHSASGEVKGLIDIPREERPPVFLSYIAFRTMAGLGFFFLLLLALGWLKRNRLTESPFYLKIMVWAIFLPYIAHELGWVLTEVGRQPWIVYGIMKTSDAASPITGSQVLVSFVALSLLYTLLGIADIYLLVRYARRGPDGPAVEGGAA